MRSLRRASPPSTPPNIEPEVHHVPVLHDVLLALHPQLADALERGLRAVLHQVGDGVDLGPDEAAGEVGVDDARRAGSLGALLDGPGADLLGAGGEVGLQAEQIVGGPGQAVQAGLGEAEVGEEGRALLVVELGEPDSTWPLMTTTPAPSSAALPRTASTWALPSTRPSSSTLQT